MALFWRGRQQRYATVEGPVDPYGDRLRASLDTAAVSPDTALRHSAVWGGAAAPRRPRLHHAAGGVPQRRRRRGRAAPPAHADVPRWPHVNINEWLYSSQHRPRPRRQQLRDHHRTRRPRVPVPHRPATRRDLSVLVQDGEVWRFRIASKLYDRRRGVAREAVHRPRVARRPQPRRVRRLDARPLHDPADDSPPNGSRPTRCPPPISATTTSTSSGTTSPPRSKPGSRPRCRATTSSSPAKDGSTSRCSRWRRGTPGWPR